MGRKPLSKEEIDALPTILDVVEQISAYENQLILPFVSQIPSTNYYDEGRYSYVSDRNNRNVVRLMPVSQSPFRFYRGQSIYYTPCIPTLYRTNNLGDISLEDQIVANRIKTSEFVLLLHTHPVYINVCQNINGNPIALAQHYGLATEYLDITNSKWVAAFFASTGYDFKTDTYYPVGREFRDGYGVMYISKEFKQGNIPDAFFDKNGVIGYQYFERPSKQSSFGYAMSLGEDFNECDYFDSVFFRHDIEASKVVFDMSYKQNRFIPKDSLSKLARIILESTEVTNSAVQLCQEWFYPDEGREFFKAVLDKKHWRIREIDSPIVEFSAEELEIEWKQWMEFGIADINARTLPVIPIAYIQ